MDDRGCRPAGALSASRAARRAPRTSRASVKPGRSLSARLCAAGARSARKCRESTNPVSCGFLVPCVHRANFAGCPSLGMPRESPPQSEKPGRAVCLVRHVISGPAHGHVARRGGRLQYVSATRVAGCPIETCIWTSAPQSEGAVLRVCGRRTDVGNVGNSPLMKPQLCSCLPCSGAVQTGSRACARLEQGPSVAHAKKLWSRSISCRRKTVLGNNPLCPL